jgi:hypothetical protein
MKVFRRITTLSALALAGLTLASTPSSAAQPGVAELAKVEGDGFAIVVTDGSAKVGEQTQVVFSIEAKDGYKVNEKYPHKLKIKDAPDGVELPKPVLKKGDGAFDGKNTFTFKLPVKAKRAGSFELVGKLKFSVCNEKACLIEKKDVRAKLVAK